MNLTIKIDQIKDKLPWRFKSKIDFTDSCWIWTTGKFKDGYGQYWADGRGISAHRYSWMKVYGEIPDGLFVCHTCDNPPCVNPLHMFLGTLQENTRDMKVKGRAAKGEQNGNSKLTQTQVEEIRKLYTPGKAGYKSEYSVMGLARKYGVGTSTVHSIVRNQIWRNRDRSEAK